MAASPDERLAELVRNYPLLYDKVCLDFRNKELKNKAWLNIAQSLGLKTGERNNADMKNVPRTPFPF